MASAIRNRLFIGAHKVARKSYTTEQIIGLFRQDAGFVENRRTAPAPQDRG